jgi:hypothetical protein
MGTEARGGDLRLGQEDEGHGGGVAGPLCPPGAAVSLEGRLGGIPGEPVVYGLGCAVVVFAAVMRGLWRDGELLGWLLGVGSCGKASSGSA